MRVLVTGAGGFLGRNVVATLSQAGHAVVAMMRPSRRGSEPRMPDGVGFAYADLRVRGGLTEALDGIEAVVHLAACVVGDDDAQFASTVVGTENLLAAMREANVTRLVHCGTFSVYDWKTARSPLDEASPLETADTLYDRDGYAISKTWQERLARRWGEDAENQLTVLRPGFIWGAGLEETSGIGQPLGPLRIVIGGTRPLPLTYVENCAEAFARVLESPNTIGETFNVVDTPTVSAWKHQGRTLRETEQRGWRVYLPYGVGLFSARVATWISKWLYRGRGKLPGVLMPNRYRARFRPIGFKTEKLRAAIGEYEMHSYDQAWERIACLAAPNDPAPEAETPPAQPAEGATA